MNAWTGHEPLRHPRPVTQPAQITVPRDRSLTITWQSLFLGMCLGWATLGAFLRAFGDIGTEWDAPVLARVVIAACSFVVMRDSHKEGDAS
jgi:hypothetical protein